MNALHTVNQSPWAGEALESCLRSVLPGSTVLLIEDGVYAARVGQSLPLLDNALKSGITVYALQADLAARGIQPLRDGVRVTDDSGFVDLVASHQPIISWHG